MSTTCSPFNVASQKYGGTCLEESSRNGLSNVCINTINGNASTGWESASNRAVDSFIKIGFHTVFTINKLRIRPNLVSGRQIKEILMEFSDCSYEKVRWQVKTVAFKPRKRRRQKQGRHAPITHSIQFIQHTRSSILNTCSANRHLFPQLSGLLIR